MNTHESNFSTIPSIISAVSNDGILSDAKDAIGRSNLYFTDHLKLINLQKNLMSEGLAEFKTAREEKALPKSRSSAGAGSSSAEFVIVPTLLARANKPLNLNQKKVRAVHTQKL